MRRKHIGEGGEGIWGRERGERDLCSICPFERYTLGGGGGFDDDDDDAIFTGFDLDEKRGAKSWMDGGRRLWRRVTIYEGEFLNR